MSNQAKRKEKAKWIFSENISHAIIRGLCNRAKGGREGSDKRGRLSLPLNLPRREVRAWASAELSVAAESRVRMHQQPQAT